MVKQIIDVASDSDWRPACELAATGKQLSSLEKILEEYFSYLELSEVVMKDKKYHDFFPTSGVPHSLEEIQLAFQQMMKIQEAKISKIFIEAVNNYDGEKIIEIAKAVLFLKKIHKGGMMDVDRALLILAKEELRRDGKKWTIREVAEYLAHGKKVEIPADGFSQLRRTLKELNFPLRHSRQIRGKR